MTENNEGLDLSDLGAWNKTNIPQILDKLGVKEGDLSIATVVLGDFIDLTIKGARVTSFLETLLVGELRNKGVEV